MTIDRFKELLNTKIDEANQNIAELEKLRIVGQRVFGYDAVYYEETQINTAKNKLKQWQNVILDIMKSYYQSDNNENYKRFQETIVRVKAGYDLKNELSIEYTNGITILKGIIETIDLLVGDDADNTHVKISMTKKKKIFISHSSADQKFAEALIDLLNTMGLGQEEIFCSSIPGYWIGNGKNFLDEIKTHFVNYDLFVIFIHSPRFYNSHVSLNEMGAAWVLQSEYCSFLTNDMEYDQMDAVVTSHEIAIKVNTNEAKSRLNDWKMRILDWFGKSDINANIWERKRNSFLETVSSFIYERVQIKDIDLSEEDINKLKLWVESDDDSMFYTEFLGGSGLMMLGATEYTINSAREKAEWRSCLSRLSSLGFIEYIGEDNSFPKYQLTEKAYKHFD